MIVYKVVRVKNSRFLSSVVTGAHEIEYFKTGKMVHPNMFVFTTLEHAASFTTRFEQIWACKTEYVKAAPRLVIGPGVISEYFEEYWSGQLHRYLFSPPAGSVLVDTLEFVEEVYLGQM